MTDVAIIGSGPAGSSLALQLARTGYDVTLVERSRFPRTKVCGDYLCAGAINTLKQLRVHRSVLAGAHSIRSIALHGFGFHVHLPLPGDGAVSLPRADLDDRLLAEACGAGAHVLRGVYLHAHEDTRALRISYRDIHGADRVFPARVLVGADGAWSTVAQRAGMTARRRAGRWAVGGQLGDQRASDELSMYVGSGGYYARNPLSANTANSMLVLRQPARPAEADKIVENITRGSCRFEFERMQHVVAIGPLRYRAARVAAGRILLTGDAAELLDPFSGQGVATALALSYPAAAAVSALLHGEREASVALTYTAQWRSIVAPRRALARLIEMIISVEFLRHRAVRSIGRDARVAYSLLAGASGVTPARDALAPARLLRLLAP